MLVLVASCTINRPSQSLECSTQADCAALPGRICTSGYCVVGTLPPDARLLDAFECPAVCNGGCDTSMSPIVCSVTGANGGSITCPTGFRCNIDCAQPGACGAIDCTNAAPGQTLGLLACDIDCVAAGSCGSITCGNQNCDVTCTGAGACGNISCAAGNCTATCSGGAAACGSLNCTGTGNCIRTCDGAAACGSMTCTTGSCIETCSGGVAACGTINCGMGRCQATCNGADSACGSVACVNSCQCDVECNNTTNACPASMDCPRAPMQKYCTLPNGDNGDRCDSDYAPQCTGC